ncbi:hypothetical protein G3576_26300 [Roseomonas stagni]|uniref:Uncharacterized protein n=1 Tax=Falsiroseomonas algicola TaxID=2716930 RepID=A0A6M1LU83_9PROT|nr:hypothetical protein [Falsiroseomonas algicola]NGM23552.1 hypothetical protein [Falsiroseomonas algicola]
MPALRVPSDRTESRQKIISLLNDLGHQAASTGDDLAARLLDDMARLLDAALASSGK